jgi:intermediate cleaving peptidase 55
MLSRTFRKLAIGQPSHVTHSHLLSPHELTIGLTKAEYASRRKALLDAVDTSSSVGIVLTGNTTRYATQNILYRVQWGDDVSSYPFQQNTNFYYTCGLDEPDTALFLGTTLIEDNLGRAT